MAITYPRDLPSFQFREFNLKLEDTDSLSRSAKGRAISVIQFEDPFWSLDAETIDLDRARRQKWDAWAETLRGGKKFVTHHVGREWPIAYYPAGIPQVVAATWNGKGVSTAISAFSFTSNGVPVGFQLKAGDLVGFEQSSKYFLMKVSEDCTANGSGIIIVPVTSPIPTNVFTSGAVTVFYKPKVSMVIIPGSFESPETTRPEPIKFKAVQKI